MIPRLLMIGTSLAAGGGGIARVARMAHRALEPAVAAGRVEVRSLVLHDAEPPADLDLAIRAFGSRRVAFTVAVRRAARWATHLHADHAGVARARWRRGPWRRPTALWLHGTEIWPGARRVWIDSAHDADLLLVNSATTRRVADAAFGGFARAHIVPLATEHDVPAQRVRRPGPPTATIIARMDADGYKGHRELIAIWPTVAQRVPGARLLVVGDGPGRAGLEAQARATGAAIEFRGFVGDDAIDAIWAETDLLAMPSRGEGFGIVYIEAMRNGVPALASVHDAGAEVNVDGVTGRNVDLDRDGELLAALVEVLGDPDKAAAYGQAGSALWASTYRASHFHERFLAAFEAWCHGAADPTP